MTQHLLVHKCSILLILISLSFTSRSQSLPYYFDENYKITNPYTYSYSDDINVSVSENDHGDWETAFSVPGIIGNIYTTASDGNNLYLGGKFKVAGSISANSIVKWDGSKWHSLGEGPENGIFADSNGMTAVLAIAMYKDYVFVGGQFSRAGTNDANGIAYWDGEKWNSLGTGINNGVRSIVKLEEDTIIQSGSVYSLFVHKDRLYVGGNFQIAGERPANGVAIWDINKKKWETMKGGLLSTDGNPSAYGYGFAEFKGQIIVGGKFDLAGGEPAQNIAGWDGANFINIGNMSYHISDIRGDGQGHIYAVGYYQEEDSSGYWGVGMWDGKKWQMIPGPEGYNSTVDQIRFLNKELIVTGIFEHSDGSRASLACWDGKVWEVIHGLGYSRDNLQNPVIKGIEYINGRYYIAGDFTKAGDKFPVNVVEWDHQNNTWKLLDDGTGNQGIYDGSVLVVEKKDNYVYAGGSFNVAGGKYIRNIGRWNGQSWESLGTGEENGINGSVFTILTEDENIFAGGYFGKAGSSEAYHIAQWNGKEWQSLGIGVGGIHGAHVRDLAIAGDYLYVAGYFSKVGDESNFDIPANSIARFNLSTRKWDAPLHGVEYDEGIPGMIYDIETQGNKVVIGGEFTHAGGQSAHNFTILEGLEFKNPGPSADIEGLVNAVEIVNDQILIGGHLVYENQKVFGVLKWTGDRWQQICDHVLGIEKGDLFVTDIEPFRNGFIAVGYFNKAGDKSLNNIAWFDGNDWLDVGGGIYSGVSDIIVVGNRLYFSGADVITSNGANGIGLVEFVFNEEATPVDEFLPIDNNLSVYPNPFRNSTTINYFVKYNAEVNLEVYDISGKRIRTLVNEQKPEGLHSTIFYSHDLDPGVYFCRIIYGNVSETLKVIASE